MAFKFSLITPEGVVSVGDVDFVTIPGASGELGIFAEHEPLITSLVAGELTYLQGGKETVMAVGDGFAEITGTSVSVLTDGAVRDLDIDEKAAKEAMERAQEALRTTTLEGAELEATQAALARSVAMLEVKQRRRGSRS